MRRTANNYPIRSGLASGSPACPPSSRRFRSPARSSSLLRTARRGPGLGSMNDDLPSFIVLVSAGQGDQPLYARLWGSGFLDSKFQGVQFRAGKDPGLDLSNPDGICRSGRHAMLNKLNELNRHQSERELDPEIESRIAQYEMAFRMQTSVPEVTDLSS